MTITDERLTPPAPASKPPSYFRRHPILAGFGVLSGLSLFAALWPVSAIVTAVAVAGHATGLDRRAWSLAERLAKRGIQIVRHRAPEPVAPVAPEPRVREPQGPGPSAPAPGAPRREAHPPAAVTPRTVRAPRPHAPTEHHPARSRRPQRAERQVGSGIDGPGA